MGTKLQQYFPMIQTKDKILKQIESSKRMSDMFRGWTEEQQEEFLNCCSGAKGFKLLYDSFFKEIFSPEYDPKPLEAFLSCIVGRKVKILSVLPNDSTRIADESTLLLTDIVVELEDGSIANVEMQKIGYKFPGERAACYSADLLLRQYKRVRNEKKKAFSYKDIKAVYTIVLFETSPEIFHGYAEDYLHLFEQKSNTGIEIELLQKYMFIPLDLFRRKIHNKGIESDLEAWLTFLTVDEPEIIIELIERYPEFKPLYEIIYNMCKSMEGVMQMFSEELRILDRNTVQLMIDEMQDEIKAKRAELNTITTELNTATTELNATTAELNAQKEINLAQKREIEELKKQLAQI